MENKKGVLITICVLLCIFTPLTVMGILATENLSLFEENPDHETFYDGYIWFYDENDEFLSKYQCQTENCNFATNVTDDEKYGINYYKDGNIDKVGIISDTYTFITDGAVTHLFSVSTGKSLQTYNTIKNYNTNLENNTYIVENTDSVWGVLSFGAIIKSILPFEYSFIGIKNVLNEDSTLSTDQFIVMKDNKWYIVDGTNSVLTGEIEDPIIDYTSEYIFSKKDNKIRIFNYDNTELLTNYEIKNYIIEDKYIGIIIENFILIYDNLSNKYFKSITITNDTQNIDLEKVDNNLNVLVDGEIKESVELS